MCMYGLSVGRVNRHDSVACVLVLHWSGGVWSEVKTLLLVMQMESVHHLHAPTHPLTHSLTFPHIHITALFAQMSNALVLGFGEEAEAIDAHCIPYVSALWCYQGL